MNFRNNYYLYISDHPINIGRGLPDSKGDMKVSILPVMQEMLELKPPPASKIKNVILSSGGAAGRINRMIKEIHKLQLSSPVVFIVLSALAKNTRRYAKLERLIDKKTTNTHKFKIIPKVSLTEYIRIIENSHAMIGFSGTYTTLGIIASGRPFGAIFDSRKSKDRIFTDHYQGNAIFAKHVLDYPVEVIHDTITQHNLDNLLSNENIRKAYYQATKGGGMRDKFIESEAEWRSIFLRFL
jgi:hypothetical protein